MAPGLRVLFLLAVCVSVIVTVETKSYSKATPRPHHTSKPVRYTPKNEKIQKLDKYRDVHSTPQRTPHYGGYPASTQPPRTVKPGYNPYYQASPKPPASQAPSYPKTGGLSGGSNTIHKQTSSPLQSYPNSGGLSGGGSQTINKQTSSQLQSYPGGGGLSGGGSQTINKQTSSPSHSYPSGGGLSGGGSQTINKQTSSPSHSYPSGGGSSGSGHNATNQQKLSSQLYPNGGGLSGGGSQTINKQTSSPSHSYPSGGGSSGSGHNATNQQKPSSQLYPNGGGLSGGGSQTINKQTSSPSHSYPNGGGLAGGAFNYTNKPPSTSHSYPNGGGLSGGGSNTITQQKPPVQSYPPSNGLSGGYPKPPVTSNHNHKPHSYPDSIGQSGGGFKPTTQTPWHGTVHYPNQHAPAPPVHIIHTQTPPDRIYVRDRHTTHIYHDNSPTIIHHYHYRPPSHVYYVNSNGMQYHYPTYRETNLPQYVYDYRSSKSRFNILLTGLALYNLGHMTKNHETRLYHNNYKPGPIEVCKFGIKYDKEKYEEVDIDCRLITDFIWTVRNANMNRVPSNMIQRLYPNGTVIEPHVTNSGFVNQRLHPNGTLAFPQLIWTQDSDVVVDALDPRFNGGPIKVKDGMKCYMKYFDGYILTAPVTKYVSCNLLQTYVKTSFNSARKIASSLLPIVITIVVAVFN